MIPASVLDLSMVSEGGTVADALSNTLDLARHVERLGYHRFWLAEHHNMVGIASAATSVVIGQVAAATSKVRVGAGGIMLPNHSPMRVAEHFKALEALYPGRVDLGLGRARGSDARANRAMHASSGEHFVSMLDEMLALSADTYPADHPYHGVRIMPDDVGLPPIWILGSSGASAGFAAERGFGYSFASHFSPMDPNAALAAYRDGFIPSPAFARPHTILGVSVICADTEAEARHLAQTVDLMWLRLRKGEFAALPSPEEAAAYPYSDFERAAVDENRGRHIIGAPEQVADQLADLAERTAASELMIVSNIHDANARLRSYELVAEALSARHNRMPPRSNAG